MEDDGTESEQISDSFVCAVCLDLLYKPIVLACGHISCFWCVHGSMNVHHESHCPICRHAYQHFPAICQMLHFLLFKIYPVTYKRRENQILETEKKTLYFSPDLSSLVPSEKPDPVCEPGQSSAVSFHDSLSVNTCSTGKGEACANFSQMESSSYGRANSIEISAESVKMLSPAAVEENNLHHRRVNGTRRQVSVADVLCAACKQLLYRPVSLNCGHVYCEACIVIPANETLRCQVCESPHPRGFPRVCLVLDHFLEEQFSSEYAQRRGTAQLKQIHNQKGNPTMGSIEASEQGSLPSFPTDENFFQWIVENGSNFHQVGCDSCGMMPIIGDRYRCKDCTEKIGFDLCGDCYNTRSKHPGRFNQKHTPEHKFEKVKPQLMLRLLRGHLSYVSAASSYASTETPENAFPLNDVEDGLVSPGSPSDGIEDQTGNQTPL